MAIDKFLLDILVCPEDKTPVTLIDQNTVKLVNSKIATGAISNRGGKPVKESIDGGLLRADGRFLYPVRKDIPIMLIEEAIPAESLGLKG